MRLSEHLALTKPYLNKRGSWVSAYQKSPAGLHQRSRLASTFLFEHVLEVWPGRRFRKGRHGGWGFEDGPIW